MDIGRTEQADGSFLRFIGSLRSVFRSWHRRRSVSPPLLSSPSKFNSPVTDARYADWGVMEESSMSLIDLSNISKPANTLIRKISDASGVIFEPNKIRRIARAKADAALIQAESDLQITDLHRRAARRWIEEEARYQKNIEDITSGALPDLKDDSNPDSMNDDWITNFFDKCRIVSDDDMKALFSRVLAGEANVPGTYTKRTVNFFSDLDKTDAELFSRLCGFGWKLGDVVPLVFDIQEKIYNDCGINFGSLIHLESIGFVHFDSTNTVSRIDLPKKFRILYPDYPRI